MFTLVVMAAGVGRRFGGDKQLAEVGAHGEAFLDYAIADAVTAGASRVVLVVRSEIEGHVRSHVEERHGGRGVEIAYVCQDRHGPQRAKPWGTAHAVLSAEPEVPGEFVVCNADDYYGPTAFATFGMSVDGADRLGADEAGLCAYRLGRTLPAEGSVNRGVCEVSDDGQLIGISERIDLRRLPGGAISDGLADDTPVSMNLWAFPYEAFGWISAGFERFLADDPAPGDECLLPTVVAEQMAKGLTVRVVVTDEAWIGVTNPDDLDSARAALAARRPKPLYP